MQLKPYLPLILSLMAGPAIANPFAGVSEADKGVPSVQSINMNDGSSCNFSFEDWDAYEDWQWFIEFSWNLSALADYRPKFVANIDWERMTCGTSRSPDLHILRYLGRYENSDTFVFEVENNGQTVAYEFDMSPNAEHHLTIKYTRVVTRPSRSPAPSSSSDHRCVIVSSGCTGLDCIIENITLSGGPGNVDNSWSNPMVCSGYNGALNGTYKYIMETNFDRVCTGSFQISSQAQSGVTVNIYENCSASYVIEY